MVASTRKNKTTTDGSSSPSKQKPTPVEAEQDSSDNESNQGEDEDKTVPVQVNNACATELKNALDDTLKSYLTSKVGYNQNYLCDDVKLGLGWTSNIIAAGISLAGWHFGWEKTQGYTAYCVGAYMVLSFALTVFCSTVEKKKVFVGTSQARRMGDKVTISTEVKPVRNFQEKWRPIKKYRVALKPHFKEFFDVDGVLDEPRWNKFIDNALKTAISKT
ncbi:hypothetical protein PSTT_07140, partial [Puccinia striiformis]